MRIRPKCVVTSGVRQQNHSFMVRKLFVRVLRHTIPSSLQPYRLQRFRTASSSSASHGIPYRLLNPKVHYRVHNNPPLVSLLGQMNLVHNFPNYFSKILSNVIFPSTRTSTSPFRFVDQNSVCISHVFNSCYWRSVQVKTFLIMKSSAAPCNLLHLR